MNEVAVAVAGCRDSRDRELKFCVHDQRLTENKKKSVSPFQSGPALGPDRRPIFRCGSLEVREVPNTVPELQVATTSTTVASSKYM
jgi:hypothetical protein